MEATERFSKGSVRARYYTAIGPDGRVVQASFQPSKREILFVMNCLATNQKLIAVLLSEIAAPHER
jgi:hypothetical protein